MLALMIFKIDYDIPQRHRNGVVHRVVTTPRLENPATTEATLELISEPLAIITEQLQRGKGVLTLDNKVLSFPEILNMAHEFGALLQFGTSYELMEFLATQ